ncbi:DUF982 domain-containing protein [Rhizobium halophilum]|uniref:DUF982 domain-containing protein n=1 Tax=Rhizobium halophilum TaxID=2846852 RepID=UPI001EFEA952|nr:DUF982 domain-containing protein [Rhizobium halophilum]MCF6370949.1 DUF982 domain-containing protein [Rhizobium halophilum]
MLLFNEPIFIDRGRYVQEIATLEDALDFLEDWPKSKRDLAYETLASACLKAYAGVFPQEAAETAFRKFARRNDILTSGALLPLLSRRAHGHSIGGR